MTLLEDLNTGKYNLVLIGILFVFMFHQYWCKTTEPMVNTSVDIKEAISQIYLADVEAIRNLSEVASKLQKDGGLTIPGNLTIRGSFNYLPKGTIVAFNSDKAPEGWALCDGTNGTPDLRGRFIRMQSDTLGGFNVWGGKLIDGNVMAYDKTIGGNSRTDLKSWILNHKFGDRAGTDHQALDVREMPVHTHDMDNAGEHTHTARRRDGDSCHQSSKCYERASGRGEVSLPTSAAGNHKHNIKNTGEGWGHNNQPPYVVLSYIMKL